MIKARFQIYNAKYTVNKDFDSAEEMFEYALQQSNPIVVTDLGYDDQHNQIFTISFLSNAGIKDFRFQRKA